MLNAKHYEIAHHINIKMDSIILTMSPAAQNTEQTDRYDLSINNLCRELFSSPITGAVGYMDIGVHTQSARVRVFIQLNARTRRNRRRKEKRNHVERTRARADQSFYWAR